MKGNIPLNRREIASASPRSVNPRDLLVLVLWFIGTALCLYLFWRDLNMTLTRLDEQPVGIITFKYNAAQRRFEDRVMWDRLQTRSPIYNGDFIRTAELSDATITFTEGGTAIDLSENSLIQIRFENSRAAIALTEGSLSVASREGSPVSLSSGETRIEIGPEALVSASAEGDNFDLSVTEGGALVATSAGIQEAAAGEVFALAAGGPSSEPRVAVISPRPGARLLVLEKTALPVNFSWRALNFSDRDSARIEISEDRSFQRILARRDASDSSAGLAFHLSPGTYFWRAYVPREGIEPSALRPSSGKLTIIHTSAPRTITPQEDSVYRFRTSFPAVRFQWTEEDYAFLYTLEAADNPALTNPVLKTQAQGTSFVSSDLGPGRWYWRVTPVFPESFEGTAPASATASFVIEQGGLLEAPRLQAPAEGSHVNIAREREDVYFSWRPDDEAASYTISISLQADLSNPIIHRTVRESFFVYAHHESLLQAGQYYWGVFLTDHEGGASPVSSPRSFTALEDTVSPRTIYPPDNYTVAHGLARDIRFAWKSNLPTAARFQMSLNADFSRLTRDEEASAIIPGRPLPAGTYYWRIVSPHGESSSFQTPAKRLNVVLPFAAPVLEQPHPAEKVEIRGEAVLDFRWQPVEAAEYYHFRLYAGTSPRGRPVYEEDSCRTTNKTLPMDAYPEGAFVWTVQALAAEGPLHSRRTGLLATGRFAMRRLTLVSLDYPPPGHAYTGLQALWRPGELRWSSPIAVQNVRFALSRNPNPFEGQPLMDIRNPEKTIRLIRLPEGSYYWTIRAETKEGFHIGAEKPSFFQVLPVPLLPQAVGLSPEDGYLINASRLRENRTIAFRWQPVAEANSYLFSLFHEQNGSRRRVFSSEQSEAAFILEDLRPLLAQGDFVWQVEAVHKAGDGFIEQRGIPGEYRFRVQVPVPGGAVRTKDPGTLYGLPGD
jgi:hypothetical protein